VAANDNEASTSEIEELPELDTSEVSDFDDFRMNIDSTDEQQEKASEDSESQLESDDDEGTRKSWEVMKKDGKTAKVGVSSLGTNRN
jgi:hypothetical protein